MGEREGEADGADVVGVDEGEIEGETVGEDTIGADEGESDGETVGANVDGLDEGENDGISDGVNVGDAVGAKELSQGLPSEQHTTRSLLICTKLIHRGRS